MGLQESNMTYGPNHALSLETKGSKKEGLALMNGRGYTGDRSGKRDTLGKHDRADLTYQSNPSPDTKKFMGKKEWGSGREQERKTHCRDNWVLLYFTENKWTEIQKWWPRGR